MLDNYVLTKHLIIDKRNDEGFGDKVHEQHHLQQEQLISFNWDQVSLQLQCIDQRKMSEACPSSDFFWSARNQITPVDI